MTKALKRTYELRDKYQVVTDFLRNQTGSVLDVGARDRVLANYLKTSRLIYQSADLGPGHDYQLDLEARLPFNDQNFDYVVALDVLEHVEHIHQAFAELARITRCGLIIGLPSMSSLPRRWSFVWRGNLGTGKYDLLPVHQGDRHRWVTVYAQINKFIAINAQTSGFQLDQMVEHLEGGRILARVGHWVATHGWLPAGWLTGRCVYFMTRR